MIQVYDERNFLIFNVSEINKVDFDYVLETSQSTLRKSVDQTKTLVKRDGNEEPPFVSTMTTKEGPYTYDEILAILATPEWTDPEPFSS